MNGNSFTGESDEKGRAVFSLVNGLYRIRVNCKIGQVLYNGTLDRVRLSGQEENKSLVLSKVVLTSLVGSEILCSVKLMPNCMMRSSWVEYLRARIVA